MSVEEILAIIQAFFNALSKIFALFKKEDSTGDDAADA